MSNPTFPKLKVPPKPQAPSKKKKNAPDRPQPSWLFPPDEENPVLNPTAKTEHDIMKEKQERAKSLDYMKRRVHAAPDRPAPPPQLLSLIGIFLTDFGFNSTSRLFTNERKARQTLNSWEDAIGKKVDKGTPTLEKIYRDWYRDWKIRQKDETSSSESDSKDNSDEEPDNIKVENRESSAEDSEASSDGFGGSDVDVKAPKVKKGKTVKKATKKNAVSLSSESSSSDSDADDEEETATQAKKVASAPKKAAPTPEKPTVGAMIKNLKRKAASSSDSDSSEDEKSLPAKKSKTGGATSTATLAVSASKPAESSKSSSSSSESEEGKAPAAKVTAKPASTSETSSDSSDVSDSDLSSANVDRPVSTKQTNGVILPKLGKANSDSSTTINGDTKKEYSSETSSSASSDASSSDSDSAPTARKTAPTIQTPAKKKHQGAKPTPLAELSAQATDDSHISNKYQPYDYAERAYQDLSVTRGKGFTKEKNKKKRGSYRGGPIDTTGGKGFKFDD